MRTVVGYCTGFFLATDLYFEVSDLNLNGSLWRNGRDSDFAFFSLNNVPITVAARSKA
jgi:hypothetical protein